MISCALMCIIKKFVNIVLRDIVVEITGESAYKDATPQQLCVAVEALLRGNDMYIKSTNS